MIGSLCSIVGIPLAVIGAQQAYVQAKRSKNAAEYASAQLEKFKRSVKTFNSVADFTRALSAIDELRRLVRYKVFEPLPDRLCEARRALIAVREAVELNASENTAFQDMIAGLSQLELQFSQAAASGNNYRPALVKAATKLLSEVDALHLVLIGMKNRIGEPDL